MHLHPVQISYDLQNAKIIVEWPWGSHAFPHSSEGITDLAEALQNYAIQRSRRVQRDHSVSPEDLLAIRRMIEGSQAIAKRYVPGSSGKREVPKLSDFLNDDDFKDCI